MALPGQADLLLQIQMDVTAPDRISLVAVIYTLALALVEHILVLAVLAVRVVVLLELAVVMAVLVLWVTTRERVQGAEVVLEVILGQAAAVKPLLPQQRLLLEPAVLAVAVAGKAAEVGSGC